MTDIERVRALAEILRQYGLSSIEIREGDARVRLRAGEPPGAAAFPALPPAADIAAANLPPDKDGHTVDFNRLTEVKSPMIGVFYSAPSPDSPPFVAIGSKVRRGDVLCIIESMKLLNEITAETDGEIVDICIRNEDIAEFGQVLFKMY